MSGTLDLTLNIWRQAGPEQAGGFAKYPLSGISEHMSFLEMLDILNENVEQVKLVTPGFRERKGESRLMDFRLVGVTRIDP